MDKVLEKHLDLIFTISCEAGDSPCCRGGTMGKRTQWTQ